MFGTIFILIIVALGVFSLFIGKGKLAKWYLMEIIGALCIAFGFMIHESLVPHWLFKLLGGINGMVVGFILVVVGGFMIKLVNRRTKASS